MDALQLGAKLMGSPTSGPLLDAGTRLFFSDAARTMIVRAADSYVRRKLDANERAASPWRRIQRERLLMARTALHTVDRLAARRALSRPLARRVVETWGRAFFLPPEKQPVGLRFKAERGCAPPFFIVIGPGHACNLGCAGCYANSGESAARLPWPMLDRIIAEAREQWGIPLVVFSGGEPLAYRSEGKGVLDVVEKHPDCMYLMFTNGTLIDQQTAARMARLKTLTPAVSVEGLRERTEERRGAGVFDRILRAMDCLGEAGVPFGVSVTATRSNCDEVLSDEFLDFFFGERGAFYGFLFHYMPIGRSATLQRMPTPEQRRTWEVIENRRIFLFDFWNSGPLAQGCVSAGREGGYIYIDWNGKVMPCVFAPYSAANIHEVYARGGTLDDVWSAPFFQAIRRWQNDYGYGRAPSDDGNWLRPCPIRDHHALFREWVDAHHPEPEDEAAAQALRDEGYYKGLVAYGKDLAEFSQDVWEEEYCCFPKS